MRERSGAVDALRGLAFCAMVVYHASWFADDHGLVDLEMSSLPWRVFQKAIAGTFYLLVGVSLRLAGDRRAGARLARIGACAAVVTVASIVLDPERIVVFGTLHCVLLTSVLARPFLSIGRWAALPGALLLAIGATTYDPRFDTPWLAWTGLGTTIPYTFDHQPFVIWMGVVLIGLTLPVPEWEAPRWLSWIGRRSLWLYMAHVPVLEAVATGLAMVSR